MNNKYINIINFLYFLFYNNYKIFKTMFQTIKLININILKISLN